VWRVWGAGGAVPTKGERGLPHPRWFDACAAAAPPILLCSRLAAPPHPFLRSRRRAPSLAGASADGWRVVEQFRNSHRAGNWFYIAPGGRRAKTRAEASALERSGEAHEVDPAERAKRRFPDGNYPRVRLVMSRGGAPTGGTQAEPPAAAHAQVTKASGDARGSKRKAQAA